MKREAKIIAAIVSLFLLFYFLPIEYLQNSDRFMNAFWEMLYLTQDYAKHHVLLCLVPAFFIAGGIAAFISSASVMKYLGPKANKLLAYGVASVSGSILAVCSCTVLPLFGGIYRMGAGLGPACTFLYAGPAINVLAIILTARVLGPELGIARAVGAVVFSIIIGLSMNFIFRKEEEVQVAMAQPTSDEEARPLWKTSLFFAAMVGILVFANWGKPMEETGLWHTIYSTKWYITSLFAVGFALAIVKWYSVSAWKIAVTSAATIVLAIAFPEYPLLPFCAGVLGLSWATATQGGEAGEWFNQTWTFAKLIMPLLFGGVLVAGLLLGRPGHEALIPSEWISNSVGGNSLFANFFASFAGALMYFATLTEVPILQGLIGNGMGKGPALALLLAGPALSLPNLLVIRSLMGTKKTLVFTGLVVFFATVCGYLYGLLF